MNKTIYIVPGYGGAAKDPEAKKLVTVFKKHGIKPVIVKIAWKGKKPLLFQTYVDQFLKQYKKEKGEKTYILGFSFGAMIAYLTAGQTKPRGLILCSLSPFFEEDFATIPEKWTKWWTKNYKETFVFKDSSPSVKSKTHILLGDKEGPEIMARGKEAQRQISGSTLMVIKGGRHNISQKQYLAELEKLIPKL